MKKLILLIILATFFLLPSAYANIVDELTKLNNLYKDGALNQEEFNKAKKILLKTGSNESEKNQPKQTRTNQNQPKPLKIIRSTKLCGGGGGGPAGGGDPPLLPLPRASGSSGSRPAGLREPSPPGSVRDGDLPRAGATDVEAAELLCDKLWFFIRERGTLGPYEKTQPT